MACSSRTTSATLQDLLEKNLERKRAGVLGAAAGQRCLVLVDDLHLSQLQGSGRDAGSVPELLREILDAGGCRERVKWSWRALQDLSVVVGAHRRSSHPRSD